MRRAQLRVTNNVHIVIEDCMLVAIQLQDALCIRHSEVLEVQQGMGQVLSDQLNKPGKLSEQSSMTENGTTVILVYEEIVRVPTNAPVTPSLCTHVG